MSRPDRKLLQIYTSIDERVSSVHEQSSPLAWPCMRGCDGCCYRLSDVPLITNAEWDMLAQSIRNVPEHFSRFAAGIHRLAQHEQNAERSVVACPFIAPDDGASRPGSCLVYEGRPAACRSYGYFAERHDVLGCEDVLTHAVQMNVVWGNQTALQRELDAVSSSMLPRQSLVAWWKRDFE